MITDKIYLARKWEEDWGKDGETKVRRVLAFASGYRPDNKKCCEKNDKQLSWSQGWNKEDDLEPLILDNTPLEGFKLGTISTRYSTQNKLFRVLDPRGFELEISAQNLLELLEGGTVAKGVFKGEFIWHFGRLGMGRVKLIRGVV